MLRKEQDLFSMYQEAWIFKLATGTLWIAPKKLRLGSKIGVGINLFIELLLDCYLVWPRRLKKWCVPIRHWDWYIAWSSLSKPRWWSYQTKLPIPMVFCYGAIFIIDPDRLLDYLHLVIFHTITSHFLLIHLFSGNEDITRSVTNSICTTVYYFNHRLSLRTEACHELGPTRLWSGQ